MGMSMDKDTLPYQLNKQRAASSKIFALCFRVGGGIMTLGGVEQRVHSKPGVSYAKLLTKDGWFQVGGGEVCSVHVCVDVCGCVWMWVGVKRK
jgi:hypothetical protein